MRSESRKDNWLRFLLVAALGLLGIYYTSTLGINTIHQTAAMAIVGIVVVVAYEYFIGWG
ncbi:MAG: hypothetical protein ACOCY6_01525 [Halodesulfurarchaeum sp.]